MSEVIKKIIAISGRNPYLCYQCGMCSATCPMAEYMDILPHQVIRLIQLGVEGLERIKSVWMCVSCMACVDKCPRHVDPGVIFEAVRLLTLRKGIDKADYQGLENLEEAPTMALIALSRKMTG